MILTFCAFCVSFRCSATSCSVSISPLTSASAQCGTIGDLLTHAMILLTLTVPAYRLSNRTSDSRVPVPHVWVMTVEEEPVPEDLIPEEVCSQSGDD